MKIYDPFDWYWIVADDEARRYGSAARDYVPADDSTYVAWADDGTMPTRIDTEFNLGVVLGAYAPRVQPIPPGILEGYVDKQAVDVIASPDLKPLVDHENRLRALEGTPPLTSDADVRAWITRTLK